MPGQKNTRPVEPGETIGDKYTIVRAIGRGGMGVVFEARHVTLGRRLALKFLRTDVELDETRLARFEREARACGALHHENIAAVVDFATDNFGRPYLVMEFVDGRSLREVLETQGTMGIERACDLICQAARGLSAAHLAGVLHRDLKPENLMLTRRADGGDWIKLLDFGVARLNEDVNALTLTAEGRVPGTAHYLAPEVASGQAPASVRSDVYSLGVVLFELLTGERPHPSGSYNAVLYHVTHHSAPPIESVLPSVPMPVAHAVNRALNRDPDERYPTALDFVAALQGAQGKTPSPEVALTITSPDARLRQQSRADDGITGTPSVALSGTPHPTAPSLGARAWPFILVLLVVGAGASYLSLRPSSLAPRPDTKGNGAPDPDKASPRSIETAASGASPPSTQAQSPDPSSRPEPDAATSPPIASVVPQKRQPIAKRPRAVPTQRKSEPEPANSGTSDPTNAPGSFDRNNPLRD